MTLPLTQKIITTGYYQISSLFDPSENHICGYEFKSSYRSCGYSNLMGQEGSTQLRRMAAHSKGSHSTGFGPQSLWSFECFATGNSYSTQWHIHISHDWIIIYSLIKTEGNTQLILHIKVGIQSGKVSLKRYAWIMYLPSSHVHLWTYKKMVCTRIISRASSCKESVQNRKRQMSHSLQLHHVWKIHGISSINTHYAIDYSTLLAS